MRHFLGALGVSALPRGMSKPTVSCRLVPAPGLTQAPPPCLIPAARTAVPVAPVTPTAQEENLPTLGPGAGKPG
jgi:hypothetical protein